MALPHGAHRASSSLPVAPRPSLPAARAGRDPGSSSVTIARPRRVAAMAIALASVFTLAGVGADGVPGNEVQAKTRVVRVPKSIDYRGRREVSSQLQRFINRVPNNSRIEFRARGVYRIRHGINLSNRRNLVLDGNGATLRARGSAGRPLDSAFALMSGARDLRFRDFTLVGNNRNAGTARAYGGGESMHGFYLGGATNILIEDVRIRNFPGDCVYVGTNNGTTWSRNITFRDSTCTGTGRHGVAIIAGRKTLIQRVKFDRIGFMVIDIEPNRSMEGAIDTVIRKNKVGSYGHTNRYVSWFVAASAGARGAAVRNLRIEGNVVSGTPRSGYDRNALGISIKIDGDDGPRSNIIIRDNRSTRTVRRTVHGAPVLIRNVSGITVTGNRQPMRSGTFAQISGSSKVVNRGNVTKR